MTDRYAVVGNPVEHSLSPQIHSAFANETGQNLTYERIEAPLGSFASEIAGFFAAGGRGLNVTLPFKEQAYDWVDEHSPFAAAAGAVNTILPTANGYLGANTDGIGLVRDLARHRVTLDGARVLLLGAGGAARGVIMPLLDAGVSALSVANRTHNKAQDLVELLADQRLTAIPIDNLSGSYDIIVNATSASLTGGNLELAPAVVAGTVCYDMVYGNNAHFARFARDNNAAQGIDGLGMLVEQAAEAFFLWRGVLPSTDVVLAQLRKQVDENAE